MLRQIAAIAVRQRSRKVICVRPQRYVHQTAHRTVFCRDLLSSTSKDEAVIVSGWLQSLRKAGDELYFATLRDESGIIQAKFTCKDDIEIVAGLESESVLELQGIVEAKPNAKSDADIELNVSDINVLNRVQTRLPFLPSTSSDLPNEEVRLRNRPLDLRRQPLQRALRLRSRVAHAARRYLIEEEGFLEVETPTLFKRTPGGAAEFLVPTQEPNRYYALVQSPQQYKQMLMVGGIDRYMQFARCYRDEGGRVDRQPEFTQLDLEMAFVSQQDVQRLTERLVSAMWKACDLPEPEIGMMTFADAMSQYGSDKPDRRFDMRLHDVSDTCRGTTMEPFEATLQSGAKIMAIKADQSQAFFTRKVQDQLREHAKGIGAKGVYVASVDSDSTLKGSIAKHFTSDQQASLLASMHARQGDVLILATGAEREVQSLLGKLRVHVAGLLRKAGLLTIDPDVFDLFWVQDFPMFEAHELHQGRLQACHHPFTAPHPDDIALVTTDPLKVRAQHYDLVLNGVELGGGSIRIHDPSFQEHILRDVLQEDLQVFEQLLQPLRMGAPPHGGIALGFDRLMLMLLEREGASSLRDVIAFPKSFAGKEWMSQAPTDVSDEDLATYHLKRLVPN